MTIQHSDIDDSNRHEAKGADAATNNTVCTANGDGTTSFRAVDYANLTSTPTYTAFALSNSSFSTVTSQVPSAINTAMQIAFGAGSVTTDVTISALGAITLNTAGAYTIMADFTVGRTAATGLANLMLGTFVNGAAVGTPKAIILDNLLYSIPVSVTLPIVASAGDVVTFQLVQASSGIANGGLYKLTATTSGWVDSPSACVNVYKNLIVS